LRSPGNCLPGLHYVVMHRPPKQLFPAFREMVLGVETWRLSGRWVFPVAQPPLEGGIVTIRGGRIAAVEKRGSRAADVDVGNAAILPGFVNAHTHLDLSALRG